MARGIFRKSSLAKMIGAYRSQWKRSLLRLFLPGYGKKGMGWLRNPKKAWYNFWYHRTSVSLPQLLGCKPSKGACILALAIVSLENLALFPVDATRAAIQSNRLKNIRQARDTDEVSERDSERAKTRDTDETSERNSGSSKARTGTSHVDTDETKYSVAKTEIASSVSGTNGASLGLSTMTNSQLQLTGAALGLSAMTGSQLRADSATLGLPTMTGSQLRTDSTALGLSTATGSQSRMNCSVSKPTGMEQSQPRTPTVAVSRTDCSIPKPTTTPVPKPRTSATPASTSQATKMAPQKPKVICVSTVPNQKEKPGQASAGTIQNGGFEPIKLTPHSAPKVTVPDESSPKSKPKHAADQYIKKRMILAGSSYCDPNVLAGLAVGDYIDLRLEPDNPYDKDAVMLTCRGEKIGYVPKQDKAPFVTCLRLGRKVYGVITEIWDEPFPTRYEFEVWFDKE